MPADDQRLTLSDSRRDVDNDFLGMAEPQGGIAQQVVKVNMLEPFGGKLFRVGAECFRQNVYQLTS